MTKQEAYWQSIPVVFQGYFDDAQIAVPDTLMRDMLSSLFTLVAKVGVVVEFTASKSNNIIRTE